MEEIKTETRRDDLNVVAVKYGPKYPASYVNTLYNMTERNLDIPHRFICLTDDPSGLDDGIEALPLLDDNLQGWWHKLTLFKEKIHDLRGTIFYMDLDVVVVESLNPFIEYEPENFCIIEDYSRNRTWFNSSVMKFPIGKYSVIWETFEYDQHQAFRLQGDQNFTTNVMKGHPDVKLWPNPWAFSAKWGHCFDRRLENPEGTLIPGGKIGIFHGKPKPHDMVGHWDWVTDNWK
jgi:hypothetical protein